jgi:hypothetical protein
MAGSKTGLDEANIAMKSAWTITVRVSLALAWILLPLSLGKPGSNRRSEVVDTAKR